jgi:hypothetical protein
MASTRKPPPGAMITAVLVGLADYAGNTVKVGTVTLRTICSPFPGTSRVLSCCAGLTVPGTVPSHTGTTCRELTGMVGAGACCAMAVAAASEHTSAASLKEDAVVTDPSDVNSTVPTGQRW